MSTHSQRYWSKILADEIHSEFTDRKGGVSISSVTIRRRFRVNDEWLRCKGILSNKPGQQAYLRKQTKGLE